MDFLRRRRLRRQYDEWAADSTLIALRVLNQAAADLLVLVENDLARATWTDGLFNPNAFILKRVAPRVREVAEPIAISIIEDANHSLKGIAEVRAIWSRSLETSTDKAATFEAVGDLAAAAVPLGAGAATAVAIPFAAFTTTTGFLGLVSTTAISWPVVVGGGALAGLGLAAGAIETSRLWSKVENRLRRRTREYVLEALVKGPPGRPAIAEQLAYEFVRTAELSKTSL